MDIIDKVNKKPIINLLIKGIGVQTIQVGYKFLSTSIIKLIGRSYKDINKLLRILFESHTFHSDNGINGKIPWEFGFPKVTE